MKHPHEAIEVYWATAEARDWDAYAALLTADVVYEMPQSRERIRGKERYMSFNTDYPADRPAWRAHLVEVY
jgi:3-phenylpropionate/cinnamic acid dioxygenase small subunit